MPTLGVYFGRKGLFIHTRRSTREGYYGGCGIALFSASMDEKILPTDISGGEREITSGRRRQVMKPMMEFLDRRFLDGSGDVAEGGKLQWILWLCHTYTEGIPIFPAQFGTV